MRRDTGENYQEMLKRLAQESGIETPTAEQLIALDKKRQGKTLSNKEWLSQTDGDARIAKLKDGRTHMAYKPEHVVDLETGAIVSVSVHRADCGDTKTIEASLERAQSKLVAVLGSDAPSTEHLVYRPRISYTFTVLKFELLHPHWDPHPPNATSSDTLSDRH